MMKKHLFLIGIVVAVTLLLIAMRTYPGGSAHDPQAVGFNWKNNYICNLFAERAINGAFNSARLWAISGWFFMCTSVAAFFIEFSRRLPRRGAASIIRFSGIGTGIFGFLAVTPLHDVMITIAGIFSLLTVFYITIFIFKARLTFLSILSIFCLAAWYAVNYVYYTRQYLYLLGVMQKVSLLAAIIWALCVYYLSRPEDFRPRSASEI
jgi:CDP-diglyceride synthetase